MEKQSTGLPNAPRVGEQDLADKGQRSDGPLNVQDHGPDPLGLGLLRRAVAILLGPVRQLAALPITSDRHSYPCI